jgi:hypothetical protein
VISFSIALEEQKHFLHHEMLRSRRTIFAQIMAKAKGADIPDGASYEDVERFLDGWIYTGYVDAGKVSSEYPCDCGRPLRQHRVQHKETDQVLHFGIVHLGDHLKLDAKTVTLIKKGLDQELDEILVKVRDRWTLPIPIPEGFPVPNDIQAHLDARLPLLDRQFARPCREIMVYMRRSSFKREAAATRTVLRVQVARETRQESLRMLVRPRRLVLVQDDRHRDVLWRFSFSRNLKLFPGSPKP